MKKLMQKIAALFICTAVTAAGLPARADTAEAVLNDINKVNDYWISHHLTLPGYDWANAAYFVGNTQAGLITGSADSLNYALAWGDVNGWSGPAGNDTGSWTKGGVFHADNQTCFQTYLDLYFLDGDRSKMARALEVMGSQIHTAPDFYWDWDDAIFMAMPVLSRLYRVTGDRLYADRLYAYFSACRDALYDEEYRLFFRDGSYIGSKVEGQKNFWARGNGWVMAALAQVLRDMPENWEHYGDLSGIFRQMAAGAAACMKDDGEGNKYWTQSMLPLYPVSDANPHGYETSGTAFMTYALLYGINSGLLDADTYLPYAEGGVNYLRRVAIRPDGLVGYVQEVGSAATRAVTDSSTENFGVGATLLALCEYYKYLGGLNEVPDLMPYITWRLNNTAVMRVGSGTLFYGGKVTPAPAPYRDGDVYLPLRALAEALGYSVEWDGAGFASVYDGDESLIIVPDSASVRRNGGTVYLNAPVVNTDEGLFVSASSVPALFDRQAETEGDLVYVGYKLRNFMPCEAAPAERLLTEILTSGQVPVTEKTAGTYEFTVPRAGGSQSTADIDRPLDEFIDRAGAVSIVRAEAVSVPEAANPPANAFDGKMSTRYAAIDFNAVFDLGEVRHISNVALSFWQYDVRSTRYELAVSADGAEYGTVFSGSSTQGQPFNIHGVDADIRYIRIIGHGSTAGEWTSLLEIIPFE